MAHRDGDPELLGTTSQVGDQCRLADSSIATDNDDLGLSLHRERECIVQLHDIPLAPQQQRRCPAP
jgi:hypothetical protein